MIEMFVWVRGDGLDFAETFLERKAVMQVIRVSSRGGVEMALARELVMRGIPDQAWRSFIVPPPPEPGPLTAAKPVAPQNDLTAVDVIEVAPADMVMPVLMPPKPSLSGRSLFGLSKLTIVERSGGAMSRGRWLGFPAPGVACLRCRDPSRLLRGVCLACIWEGDATP